MIFADKLIMLRKKNGMSQEDLANEIGVSRQSVSKWEGAQSVPDLTKIIKISKFFGVSTDYLLKDEIEQPDNDNKPQETGVSEDNVVDEEAIEMSIGDVTGYFKRTNLSSIIMCAALACIMICPAVAVLILQFDSGILSVVTVGVLLAAGLAALIAVYIMEKKYTPLKTQSLALEYGGAGIAEDNLKKYGKKYRIIKTVGIICVSVGILLSLCALVTAVIYSNTENYANPDVQYFVFWTTADILFSAGVFLLPFGVIRLRNIYCILEEGRFSPKNKKRNAGIRLFSMIYIGLYVVAVTLSFMLNITVAFLICIIGLIVYAVIYSALVSSFIKKNK